MQLKFKDWYAQKYGPYPGIGMERTDVIFIRLADAMAEWCDMIAAQPRTLTMSDLARAVDPSGLPSEVVIRDPVFGSAKGPTG